MGHGGHNFRRNDGRGDVHAEDEVVRMIEKKGEE
jgi:hypothetical protein